MKKAKNQTSVSVETKLAENSKNEKNAQGIPSEKIRGKDKTEKELPFKKVLYGYDPDEVASYINELSESYEASARIHESKISSIKEELVLSNRERDSYIKKYKECAEKFSSQPAPAQPEEDKSAEHEAIIESLKQKLAAAEAENSRLLQSDNSSLLNEYSQKSAALEDEICSLSARLQASERENAQMLAAAEKYDALLGDYQAVCAQLEHSKAEAASKENKNAELREELNGKISELNALTSELDNTKKKSAELEAENGVLSKSLEECRGENLHLKEAGKTQAYEYAEKISALESEHANAELAMKKELKLHNYYINQAESALAQLTEQMEQIKQSMENMQKI